MVQVRGSVRMIVPDRSADVAAHARRRSRSICLPGSSRSSRYIVSRGGEIVTKDELLEHFWPDVNVTENTLTRAIADIRKAIGDDAADAAIPADRGAPRLPVRAATDAVDHAGTDPFQEWVKGRLALDSLDAQQAERRGARRSSGPTAELPRYAPAHAGLANAYLLQYERTRSGSAPDRELLARAMNAARQASTLDPSLGEALGGARLFAVRRRQDRRRAGRGATGHGARARQLAASLPPGLRRLGRGTAARRRSHAGADAGLRAGADAGVHGVRGARHDRSRRARGVDRRRGAAAEPVAITRRFRRSGFTGCAA